MKAQMRFQKILCLITLIISAIAIVYAFAFFTGGLATVSDVFVGFTGDPYSAGEYYDYANGVNDTLLTLGIIYLVCVVFMYIFACNKRRNYYLDNKIVLLVSAAYIAVYAIVCFVLVATVHSGLSTGMDWEALYANETALSAINHTGDSPAIFIIGYVFFVICLIDAAAIILNLIWKMKLMKGEKELLKNGLAKEVA